MTGLALAALFALSAACGRPGDPPSGAKFFADTNPERLSSWGVFSVSDDTLTFSDGVVPYDLATPLFTDYAQKLRTIWMPEGTSITLDAEDGFVFPVGTVISKTFYYPTASDGSVLKSSAAASPPEDLSNIQLIETRLLVHRAAGWEAVSYVWNETQREAELTRIGAVKPLTLSRADGTAQDFAYIVPNINQCSACHAPNHTTKELSPLGVAPRHLNKPISPEGTPVNQLDHWASLSYLTAAGAPDALPRNVDWQDSSAPLNDRARAYLDINCGHCHNPVGPADTSGLDLSPSAPLGKTLGLCKTPIAAGHGTGGRLYDILPGDPDGSILLHRMEITDPGALMPELGRSMVHEEGTALIRAWITEIEGACKL